MKQSEDGRGGGKKSKGTPRPGKSKRQAFKGKGKSRGGKR